MTGSICIFAKPPIPGRCKTRLAAAVGDRVAADLARAFLADTVALVRRTGARPVLATTDVRADFGALGELERVDQGEGDLGARVERVLRRELQRGPWAIALGADSPGLPFRALERAIEAATAGRSALGRTRDGGFYALGLERCPDGLLDGIPWSHPTTAERTWERLCDAGLDPIALDEWFDVDHAEDLEQFRSCVPREDAPHTLAALRGLDTGP